MKRKIISFCTYLVLLAAVALAGCGNTAGHITIVVPEGEDTAAAQLLQQAFLEGWGREYKIVTDASSKKGSTEILVGLTSREASQQAAEGLREKDFTISFDKTQIAIAAGSGDKLLDAVRYFAGNYLDYYMEPYLLPDDPSINYTSYGPYPLQRFTLEGVNIGQYAIVTADGAETPAAAYLRDMLQQATGYRFDILAQNQVEEGRPALVFGSSGYGQAKALAASLGKAEYLLQAEGSTVYLCASAGGDELVAAKMLVLKYMGYDSFNKTAAEREVRLAGLDTRFTTQITKTEGYEVLLEQVLRLPAEGVFTVFQGGCTDGTYAYYIMNNQTHHPYTNYVYKVDIKTWKVVARSEELSLDHGNSLGYNKVINKLVVSNYEPNYTTLTMVDPDTLEITERVTVDFNALSIAHNANRDQYVIGLSGTYNFVITDGDFNVLSYNEGPNYGHIKQEVDCDDDFIYFTQSNENHIIVHDWQGNYITDVKLGMYIEVENMINVDGAIYTGYFTNGGLVYETIIYRELG